MAFPAGKERYTFADVLTWDEGERIELIDGEAFMMDPPSRIHQKISFAIGRQIGNYLEGKKVKSILPRLGCVCLRRTGTRRKMLIRW